jgi:hypothetical protein
VRISAAAALLPLRKFNEERFFSMSKKVVTNPEVLNRIPTFNLRNLRYATFLRWQTDSINEPDKTRRTMKRFYGRIDCSRRGRTTLIYYVINAYAMALRWVHSGDSDRMIFLAVYDSDALALGKEVDIFTAALCFGPRDEALFSLSNCIRACKYAWCSGWDQNRFEFELLCWGIRPIAKRWTDVTKKVAAETSPAIQAEALPSTFSAN